MTTITNKIDGVFGVGTPGKTGNDGKTGYNTIVSSDDASVLTLIVENEDSSLMLNKFHHDYKEYSLATMNISTYYKNEDKTTTYYQIDYALNNNKIDDLEIFAYMFFGNTNSYIYPILTSNEDRDPLIKYVKSEFITLKKFYEPVNSIKTDIVYDKNNSLSKIIVFAYEKSKGYVYKKIFLGEKEF